jgi:hypothetical protein
MSSLHPKASSSSVLPACEVCLLANETAASSALMSSSTSIGSIPKRSPSMTKKRASSPSWALASLKVFLSLDKALLRSVRALRSSLSGHRSSARFLLWCLPPSAAR